MVIDPFLKEWCTVKIGDRKSMDCKNSLSRSALSIPSMWPGAGHLTSPSLSVPLSDTMYVKYIQVQQLTPAKCALNPSHWYTASLEGSSRILVKNEVSN